MTYEISELHETDKGLTIEVTGKPNETATTPTIQPIFYDSSNDENLFFTLPDLNFDSNSGEDDSSVEKEPAVDVESPIKSEIEFTDYSLNVDGSSSDIKNFSVMKRYLKKEKQNNIIIELNEVDEAGVVLKTQIVQADEFSVATSTSTDKSIAKTLVKDT